MVMSQVRKDVIGVLAVQVAEAGVDPHDFPGKFSPVWTCKAHFSGLRLVGCTAPIVHADSTEFWSVAGLAHTSRQGIIHGVIPPVHCKAFLPRL